MSNLTRAIEEAVKKFPGVLTSTSKDGTITFKFPDNKETKFVVDGMLVDKIRNMSKKSQGRAFNLAKKKDLSKKFGLR